MKLKDILNIKNIKSFIEGNIEYYRHHLTDYPRYKKEQVLWRMTFCKDDCLKGDERCVYCSCPSVKKVHVAESCNAGERFPDMMDEPTWEQYKIDNGIKL
jgi:hypothetical protein|tara:strand:- start:2739 stop:3038 length:300 start_codon:yes stop_codon:yes gene_type:complete